MAWNGVGRGGGGEHHPVSGQAQESQPDTDVGPQFLFSLFGHSELRDVAPLRTKLTLINSLSATTTTAAASQHHHHHHHHRCYHLFCPPSPSCSATPTPGASLVQTNIVALTSLAANGERILSSSRDLLIAPQTIRRHEPDDWSLFRGCLARLLSAANPLQRAAPREERESADFCPASGFQPNANLWIV